MLATAFAQDKLTWKDFKITSESENNLTYNLIKNNPVKVWPDNDDGSESPTALIRVSFENLSEEERKSVVFGVSPNQHISQKEFWEDDTSGRCWIWVNSNVGNAYIEATLQGGAIKERFSLDKLQPKGVYEITLMNEKSLTINVRTLPQSTDVKVMIDGRNYDANADIPNIRIGKHRLEISYKGQQKVNEEIIVSESSVTFGDPYDFRETKKITFTSDPKGATLYINGEAKGRTPLTLELPYDRYTVEAKLGPGEEDQTTITVDGSTADIKLEPIKKKTFEVIAMYNGSKVDADFYLDGKAQEERIFSLPIGKTYSMNMTYLGNSAKKRLRIANEMSEEQIFTISARNQMVWPWQREYDSTPLGFSIGYVSKQLVTRGEGEKLKENGVWDDGEGSSLHGVQMGFHVNPCLSFGLGFYTGLFYEFYLSSNDGYDYDKFNEHCLYLPAHAYFRLPFGEKVALAVHGGLGFNYSVYGAFSDKNDYYEEWTDFYGEQGFPKRFNMAAEIGLSFRIGAIQLNAQYAKGINDHGSYSSLGDFSTKQNKLSLSVSWVFGSKTY